MSPTLSRIGRELETTWGFSLLVTESSRDKSPYLVKVGFHSKLHSNYYNSFLNNMFELVGIKKEQNDIQYRKVI